MKSINRLECGCYDLEVEFSLFCSTTDSMRDIGRTFPKNLGDPPCISIRGAAVSVLLSESDGTACLDNVDGLH